MEEGDYKIGPLWTKTNRQKGSGGKEEWNKIKLIIQSLSGDLNQLSHVPWTTLAAEAHMCMVATADTCKQKKEVAMHATWS